jgi:hypothetical protein
MEEILEATQDMFNCGKRGSRNFYYGQFDPLPHSVNKRLVLVSVGACARIEHVARVRVCFEDLFDNTDEGT